MFIINSSVSYGEWTVTQEPNCLMTGVRMHTCPLGGKYEHEDIPALGHTLVNSEDIDTKICSICGLMDGEIVIGSKVTAKDHAFEVVDAGYTQRIEETTYFSGGHSTNSQEGSYIAITLKFTNLATSPFGWGGSGRVKNIRMIYDGTYEYNGEDYAFDDIVPLDTGNVFILYTVRKCSACAGRISTSKLPSSMYSGPSFFRWQNPS